MELYDSVMASNRASRLKAPLRVALLPDRGCWISLPQRLAAQLLDAGAELPLVVALVPVDAAGEPLRGARPLYAAWQGDAAVPDATLGVPALLAACLGLRHGAAVRLRPLGRVPVAEAVSVEPLTGDDWEVVDLNAEHLEERLLEQVGAVAVGQPLPLWARQAAMRLRVTSITPEGLEVARLAPGTEVHVAPKPRLGGDGGAGAPQQLLGGGGGAQAAAAQNGAQRGQAQQQQQQQQRRGGEPGREDGGAGAGAAAALRQALAPPRSAWLRAVDAGPSALLAAQPPAGPAAADGDADGAPPIHSWLTSAAALSGATATDQGLSLSAPALLCAAAGAAAAAAAPGGARPAPPQLAVLLLRDDSLPWGHVALAPPLRAALGVAPRAYVRLEQAASPPPPQLLGSCPAFELRPLVRGGEQPEAAEAAAAPDGAGGGGGDGGGEAAPAARPTAAAGGEGAPYSGGGWAAALANGLHGALSSGLPDLGALLSSAAGALLPAEGAPAPGQTRPGKPAAGAAAPDAAARDAPKSRRPDAGAGPLLGAAAAAAVDAWLRLQLAALAARAAVADGAVPSVARADGGGGGGSDSSGDGADGGGGQAPPVLPMTGPLLVHFRLPLQASGGDDNSGEDSNGDDGSSNPRPAQPEAGDHLIVLFPQLPASCQARPPAWWGLPLAALPPQPPGGGGGGAPMPADGGLKVSISDPLLLGPPPEAASAISRLAPTLAAPSAELRPAAFAWLRPPLRAAARRLRPRLDLRRWHALRCAGLPLAGGPLICGGAGSGKTALLHLLGASLQNPADPGAPPVHAVLVSCRGLAGARFERAASAIGAAVSEARARCPGLVLLDDLDLLCPAPGDGPEAPQHDADAAARAAEWLSDLMRWAASQPRAVAFAGAARAAAALPPCLRQAGCLDCEVRLPAPGAAGRTAMLLRGLRERGCELSAGGGGGGGGGVGRVDGGAAGSGGGGHVSSSGGGGGGESGGDEALSRVAEKAEGFDAKDIGVVVDRALHLALRRQLGGSCGGGGGCMGPGGGRVPVTAADLEAALEGFVPAAFRSVGGGGGGAGRGKGGAGGGPEGWVDVGGLREAREALVEALELPLKWRDLVACAPLRLRTGLLLYGPPGCGKTHVVGAAVAAVGARLITVKGPELLNKYIGASEAAVRDLFARAASAAPCVLFFDEFDAIAPPRGHDSTGVTDRVVNQLLTELDGVEGLKGVTVLAATSRPDLIDAALLRPGRLDRLVLCGMPAAADRAAILAAAARRTPLGADVDLSAMAGPQTEGFTGADLAALLSEAQLIAVHEELDKREAARRAGPEAGAGAGGAAGGGAGAAAGGGAPVVRAPHVLRALARARPSLPPAERARLEGVYARFMAGRDPELANRQARADAKGKGKRATLA
ncbi:hypothetical protein Rsub_12313 [Raphidocelis subcapitata]|uniref:Peroxisomal ATPase PEX1 n=1 Tax=Raphidocelis subcapitata TaxID=307507 RepID=A0A2V0PIJ4_9CHLO|nr:hypothetical protein Rsub_12313 [Raphidocelis subcapitata]|eukprot:GBF99634.1 hypothetical protein Rsub_12313 [Raphidocelis subcapitata]